MYPMAFLAWTPLATGPLSAADRDVVTLEPAGPWNLDMGENRCRIARLFGEGDKKTLFYLEQWDPSREALWSVAGPPVERYRPARNVRFQFGPEGDSGEFELRDIGLGDYGRAVSDTSSVAVPTWPNFKFGERNYALDPRGMPALNAAGAETIATLTLSQHFRPTIVLDLGSLGAPLKAMNVCMADLVSSWGFDVEAQKAVQSPPVVTNFLEVAKKIWKYYPEPAERKGAQADFHLRMTVGADGAAKACVLLNQTLAPDFDMRRHPCTFFTKFGKFEPARTASGAPIETFYVTRIWYTIS